ncbi:MAG: hypothetical protein A3J55_00460 [Candidatus Ryanbacteria bacterium RIFCSPHIGHO2_02_FULL_45_17b]|uniref:NADH:ubiquinone reductase (non-electrogenic) n=1 Tax=Candidatus Ryanbacteria bacterium RIFCSPHIGHO2_01_FULL_45_22 TaxID=1802114 RepID=A0A1G2G1V3_9BACT|nr:MAG: hypothetical protein A2719_02925 [Candidatus Ryanbacteria bacterium RIFCSPHIGHO2_01_FULL_45_22]OGZ47014.1 MAG: hypothetical protein A3J55_00460 [Candidatus Ryanbacteria bacterium RIFCSPHIGHO2_02_FULL_45_17b]
MRKEAEGKTRIVILGAGFAGVYAYLRLHKLLHDTKEKHITFISERDLFTFVPMIHEVATGTLLPSSITQSIRSLPPCCLNRFIEARVMRVDIDAKKILVHHLNPEAPDPGKRIKEVSEEEVPFDYAILALGSDVNFFNIPGAKEHTLTLSTLEDARRVKNRIIESFEQAQITKSEAEKRRLLRFVIAGGGLTGVELAGELADLLHGELKKAFPLLYPYAEIHLYEGRERFICFANEWFGNRAFQILSSKHVRVFCGMPLSEVSSEGIHAGGEFVPAGTVIWTAGVQAREIEIVSKKRVLKDVKSRRIKVNEYLQVLSYPYLFVAGDQAWIEKKERDQPYPMRAQFAVREGEVAAENIVRLMSKKALKEFFWRDKGLLVSVGKGTALAEVSGIQFSGVLAWVLYRVAYLLKIVGLRAKFRTALEWILNTFLPRDISKL